MRYILEYRQIARLEIFAVTDNLENAQYIN